MGSRDRESKTLDKLKVFLKRGAPVTLPAHIELVVSPELERDLGSDSPLNRRLRTIKDVSEKALVVRIEEINMKKIWTSIRDLLYDTNMEARHAALGLLRNLADGQGDTMLIMRTILFHYLKDTHPSHAPEDFQMRFKLLYTLTNTGRNISSFEEQIGPFLLEWLPQVSTPTQTADLLHLVINIVKFNAAYLDEEIVHGIVDVACHLCVYSADSGVVQSALALLEAVASYSLLPHAALGTFVSALCRTVNLEQHCQPSWKLMRIVMGADIGHAALQQLVDTLAETGEDAGLVRGAVFYVSMALWGARRVPTLQVSWLAVLPALLAAARRAAAGGNTWAVVTYELLLALHSMVSRAAADLTDAAWDVLLRVLRVLTEHQRSLEPANELIQSRLQALVTAIEQSHDSGQYHGDVEQLLDFIDFCGHDRPESSTNRLVSLRAAGLSPARGDWLAAAAALADRHLRHEPRPAVRLHTLHALHDFMMRHSALYLEEVAEMVGVPVLSLCAVDADSTLRAAAVRPLADLAGSVAGDACPDLIDALEKILNRPFEAGDVPDGGPESVAARRAGSALVALVPARWLRAPAAHAARALLVLLDHLDLHYKRPSVFMHLPDIRIQILDMLFGLRTNAFNNVGFCYDSAGRLAAGVWAGGSPRARPLCSPHLTADPPPAPPAPAPPPAATAAGVAAAHTPTTCSVPAGRVAGLLATVLSRERDWAVLSHVLRALPHLLAARALALGRRATDLDLLAATLCAALHQREPLRAPAPLHSEVHAAVLPALAAFAPYSTQLETHTQTRLVHCLLKYGMALRAPAPYIAALTVFTLEARDTMVKILPGVLLDLSKISDTAAIASPMLEFLSTLTRLPRVFASFVEDQYMSVFAILLPYTNPSRYNHYVVSLAHHVVAAWFLKCRLAYRKNFVQFIIHGLQNYIIMPFEEQLQYKSNNVLQSTLKVNEDSSNRKRSSSLDSKNVSRIKNSRSGDVGGMGSKSSSSAAFHVELTETCVDLLARYTFTPCSVKPQRSDTAEFMFKGGQSTTWLVGHKLITITTSGCQQNTLKQGLCDRCAVLCRQHAASVRAPLPAPDASPPPAPPPVDLDNTQIQINETNNAEQSIVNGGSHQLHAQTQAGAPSPHEIRRQNSSENSSISNVDVYSQLTQRFEALAKEMERSEEESWSTVGALARGGACPCWCAQWAEVRVRAPSGDVSWAMRLHNRMHAEHLLADPLHDLLALLRPAPAADPAPRDAAPPDTPAAPATPAPPHHDLYKSSSDSVVAGAGEKKPPLAATHCIGPPQPHRMSTQPINIPASPQRVGGEGLAGEDGAVRADDMLLVLPEGKSRHPVRRSNSSPEMSSSWKQLSAAADAPATSSTKSSVRVSMSEDDIDPEELILLPAEHPSSSSSVVHGKKSSKKTEMRVSCEAIPEEMSGTSPHSSTHPHLMTYSSDPGTGGGEEPQAGRGERGEQGGAAHAAHLQKTASEGAVSEGRGARLPPPPPPAPSTKEAERERDREDLPPLARSKRSNTISVMSPTRRNWDSVASRGAGSGAGGAGGAGGGGGGVTPAFVLLQLYHNMSTYPVPPRVPGEASGAAPPAPAAERPLKVSGVQHERTIKNLDLLPPIETYKVGVLYVGPGQQDDQVAILKNEYGSVRYTEFLSQLGTLVSLERAAEEHPGLFLNLETGGQDGRYTYVWNDDIVQVLFHVATAMPSLPSDDKCNEKLKYIGNDFVSIVYNDSGEDFNISTIKGAVNLCAVVVEPGAGGAGGACRVTVRCRSPALQAAFLSHLAGGAGGAGTHVSRHNAGVVARQHALHAHLATQLWQSLRLQAGPIASNALERLRAIKRLRRRLEEERAHDRPPPYCDPRDTRHRHRTLIDDFNLYT